MTTEQQTKITINGVPDPMCPKCDVALFGVAEMVLGKDKGWKHYGKCPECGYKTEAK